MKTDVQVIYAQMDSWVNLYFYYDLMDNRKVLHFRYETFSDSSDWFLLPPRGSNKNSISVPNFHECKYMDEYESTLFQESLVWDKNIPLYLLLGIQDFAYDSVRNKNLMRFEPIYNSDGRTEFFTHTFEY